MNDFIILLNDNSGAFSVIFSAVVTFSTVVYAILTWILVRETKRMRKVHTEPLIDVTYTPHDSYIGFLDLHIKNIGSGPAYGISFEIKALSTDPVCEEHVEKLKQKNFFGQGINYLSPGQCFTTFFTSTTEDFDSKMRIKIQIEVAYKSLNKNKFKQKYLIDLSELNGLERVGTPDLHKIAQGIEKLQKDIHRITGSGRLKTNVYTASMGAFRPLLLSIGRRACT